MQKLTVLGIIVILAGFAVLSVGALAGGNASVGGVVFIGPFPIVFGAGPSGWELALGSVVIGGVMVLLLFLWAWGLSRSRGR